MSIHNALRSRITALAAVLMLVTALGGSAESRAAQAVEAPSESLTRPYPPARWRLARTEDLEHVLLWVSHILVRHEGVAPGVVSFQLRDWTPSAPPPRRTRKEAFDLAEKIAEQLQQHPEGFAVTAREVSEDVATRALGGSLGGISAIELKVAYAQVLDALAALQPGEVSRVVETPYGFHVFMLRPAPSKETVTGSRIVIAYDEAPWLKAFLARRTIPARPRAQALALAESVYQRARNGESFDALVEAYSDHEEAQRHGDFGTWSTHQRAPFPKEIEILQQLAIGEIAPPLDSPFGVEIIRRTANRARQELAMTTVQQAFASAMSAPGLPSRQAALADMQRLAAEVQADPARFAALQKEYCCTDVQQWIEADGSASADAERAVAKLKPGEISPDVVLMNGGRYAIVQRVAAKPRAAPTVTYALPAPEKPDLQYLAGEGQVSSRLPEIGKEALAVLGLQGAMAEQFVVLHEVAGADEAETAEERVNRFAAFLSKIEGLLGAERFRRYQAFLDAHFEKLLLTPRSGHFRRVPRAAIAHTDRRSSV